MSLILIFFFFFFLRLACLAALGRGVFSGSLAVVAQLVLTVFVMTHKDSMREVQEVCVFGHRQLAQWGAVNPC